MFKTIAFIGVATAVSAGSVQGQMVGGNGLCSTATTPGLVGGYSPVDEPWDDSTIRKVAKDGTTIYLNTPAYQSDIDRLIIKTCKAKTYRVTPTVEVDVACKQVVSGMNYKVQSSFYVPCSKTNIKKLPAGTSLERYIITEAYVPWGNKGTQVEAVYASDLSTEDNDDDDNNLLENGGRKMLGDEEDNETGDFAEEDDDEEEDFDDEEEDFDEEDEDDEDDEEEEDDEEDEEDEDDE
jgi:hypothetical protein